MNQTLYNFLSDRIPADIDYMDLAQICMGLYAHLKYIPTDIQPLCNKEDLSEAVALFVQNHFDCDYGKPYWSIYGARLHKVTEKGHWIEVMASICKKGNTLDIERESILREKLFGNNRLQRTDAAR